MLKSNKLIIFLISLPFLMVFVFYSLSEHPGYSDDGNFVRIMRLLLRVRSSYT